MCMCMHLWYTNTYMPCRAALPRACRGHAAGMPRAGQPLPRQPYPAYYHPRTTEAYQAAARKQWAASLEARFPDRGGASLAKLYSLDLDPKAEQLLRHLTALTPRQLEWRKSHPYKPCLSHPSPSPCPHPSPSPSPNPYPNPIPTPTLTQAQPQPQPLP